METPTNKMKVTSVLAGALLFALSASATSTLAAPISGSISMTPRTQQQTNWCWAANIEAVLGYLKKYSSQTDIVTSVKGSPVNKPATWSETQRGLSNYGKTSTYSSTFSYTTLTAEIYNYARPVMVGWQWTTQPGGHMVVATGYSDDGFTKYVDYMDPKSGTFRIATYSWMVGGNSLSDHICDGSLYQIQ